MLRKKKTQKKKNIILCVRCCRKINLYPKGSGSGKDSHISLYVQLVDPETIPQGSNIFVETTVRIIDRIHSRHHSINSKDRLACFYFIILYMAAGGSRRIELTIVFFVVYRQ